jgi:hypothetical protein
MCVLLTWFIESYNCSGKGWKDGQQPDNKGHRLNNAFIGNFGLVLKRSSK